MLHWKAADMMFASAWFTIPSAFMSMFRVTRTELPVPAPEKLMVTSDESR